MKGTKLFIQVLLAIITVWIVVMYIASGGDVDSWSEADLTKLRWMLLLLLSAIARLWWKFADKHLQADTVLLHNWWGFKITYKGIVPTAFKSIKTDYTLQTAFEVCGWLFIGIAVFGLSISGFFHYLVTIFAALATLITVINSIQKHQTRIYYSVGFGIGILAWALGFFTNLWTVYLGEIIYFITPAIWILNESEKVE